MTPFETTAAQIFQDKRATPGTRELILAVAYALNGPAQADHDPLDPIWLEDEEIAQAIEDAGENVDDAVIPKVPVDALIDAAG